MFNKECCICKSKHFITKCDNCKKYFCYTHLYKIEGIDGDYCDDCIIEIYNCPNCSITYNTDELIRIDKINSKDVDMDGIKISMLCLSIIICPFCFFEVDVGKYKYKIKNICL